MSRAFPIILLMTLAMAAVIAAAAWLQWSDMDHSDGTTKINLGVVGNTDGSYLSFGLFALKNMDASRFTLNLVELDEEEAKKELLNGDISGYVVIPENFMSAVSSGENGYVTYVCKSSQSGIDVALIQELAEAVSDVVVDTETGMYAMYDFYDAHDQSDKAEKAVSSLDLSYFDMIFGRLDLYNIEETGSEGQVSTAGYYLCAALLCFLLLWGMNCAYVLIIPDMALPRLLKSQGLGSPYQALAELLSCFLLMFFSIGLLETAAAIIMAFLGFPIAELNTLSKTMAYFAGLIPVLLLAASMQYLLYTIVSGLISGLMLNFILGLVLALLGGCFYPVSSFPAFLQTICAYLPSGLCLNYMKNLLKGIGASQISALLIWSLLLFGSGILIREFKIRSNID